MALDVEDPATEFYMLVPLQKPDGSAGFVLNQHSSVSLGSIPMFRARSRLQLSVPTAESLFLSFVSVDVVVYFLQLFPPRFWNT